MTHGDVILHLLAWSSYAVSDLVKALRKNPEDCDLFTNEVFICLVDLILPPHPEPGIDSSCNKNKYYDLPWSNKVTGA